MAIFFCLFWTEHIKVQTNTSYSNSRVQGFLLHLTGFISLFSAKLQIWVFNGTNTVPHLLYPTPPTQGSQNNIDTSTDYMITERGFLF